jgi:PAS domain S-box-containing protein
MKEKNKTQKQHIKELTHLHRRIAELEASGRKRNQFEETLRTERDKAQQYLDIAEVILVALNKKGEITLINRKGNQILGYKEGELLGKNWFTTCVPSHRRKKIKSGFLKLMSGKIKLTEFYENPALTKSGTERIMAWHNSLLKDTQDNNIGTLSSGEDITERKRAEAALRESEEHYKILFDEAPVGICLADAETGIIIDCNEALAALVCRERAELVGRPQKILHPQQYNKEAFSPTFKQHLTNKEGQILETQVVTRTGDIREVEIKANLLDLQGSKVLQGFFRDITARKQAEEILRESEERFRLAFENANTGVCLVDLEGNLTRVNKKMCEIFGYTKEELERMTVNDIAHPEDIDKSPEFIQKTLQGEMDRGTFHKRYFHKKGHVVTCEISSSLVRNAAGTPLYFISHLHDITDRKQVEEQIRESQQRFQGLVETLSDWIWEVDQNGIYTYVSPRVRDLLGFEPEKILGMTPFDLMPPEEAERVKGFFESLLAARQPLVALENTCLHQDGRLVVFETSGAPFFDAGGQFMGYRGVDRDITERKLAEEALRERQETINAIIETSQDWIWAIDSQGVHTYSNPAIEKILGYRIEEIVGSLSLNLIHEDDKKIVESILRECEEKRCGWNNLLLRWRHKNGSYRYLESNAVPILNAKGDLIGFRGVDRDITERKQAEEALRQSEERMKSIFRAAPIGIGVVANRVIMDINTRICEMTGYSRKELVGSSARMLYATQDDFDYVGTEKYRQIAEKGTGSVETRWIKKDGTIIDILLSSTPMDASDQSRGVTFTALDITERKRSEERYQTIIRTAMDGFALLDMQGHYKDVNEAYCNILGYSRDELLNMAIPDIEAIETPQDIAEHIRKIREIGYGRFETRQRRKDGKIIDVEVSAKYVPTDGERMIGFYRDITDRKSLQETLDKERGELRLIIDSSPIIVFYKDKDGRFIRVNKLFAEALKMREEDFVDKTVFDFYSPKIAQGMTDDDQEVLQSGLPKLNIIEQYESASGLRWVRSDKIPIFDEHGNPSGLIGFAQDITERKQAQEALQESEEKYRDLVENINDILYSIDEHGIITYIAPAIESLSSYAPSDIIGRSFFEFVYREDVPYMMEKFRQDISGQIEPHEYRMLNKSGDIRWVRTSSRPFHEKDRVVGLRGILTDITDRKQAEEEIKRSYEQLQETLHATVKALASTVEMKDQYTAGHQPRATKLACAIAEEMGLPAEQIEGIRMAASIHDLGKIMVPAEILNKPGPLTEIQYEMIKMHPRAGYDILKGLKLPWPVAQIILQHHERMDGSGYPQGLSGEEIMVEARILSVANVVEAMNAHRPYRPAYDIKEALAEISKNSGTFYDATVVDACLRLFTKKGFTLDSAP